MECHKGCFARLKCSSCDIFNSDPKTPGCFALLAQGVFFSFCMDQRRGYDSVTCIYKSILYSYRYLKTHTIYLNIHIRLNIYYISQTGKIYTSKFTLGTSIFRKLCNEDSSYGGFLKWWYPTTMGFPTKNDHFGVFWGVAPFQETPISLGEVVDEAFAYICYTRWAPTSHK